MTAERPPPHSLDAATRAALFDLVVGHGDAAYCLYDADEAILWWNDRYVEFFPEVRDILAPGLPFLETVRLFLRQQHPDHAEPDKLQPYLDMAMRRHREERGPLEYQRASDGRWVELRMFPLPQGGRFKIWRDVTAQHKQQAVDHRLFDLLTTLNAGLLYYDADGQLGFSNIRFFSELFTALVIKVPTLRLRRDRGTYWRGFAGVFAADPVFTRLTEEVGGRGPLAQTVTLQTLDGRWVRIEEQDWSGGLVSLWVDVTALKRQEVALAESRAALIRANARLTDMAEHDPLTRVFNRRKFLDIADAGIVAAQTEATAAALILLDLDHFKSINDRHGHQAGDEVLRAVASRLRRAVGPGAAVGRLGGEEFAIFLPGAGRDEAVALAEGLRRRIAGLAFAQGHLASASFGVVELRPGEDMRAMTARADLLLYEAKRAGRNRVAVDRD
jgi:diguanylate cyclase (GGDEF)-like protein